MKQAKRCRREKQYIKHAAVFLDTCINLSGWKYLLIHLAQNIVLKTHSWLQIQPFTELYTCRQLKEIFKFNFNCNGKLIIKLTSSFSWTIESIILNFLFNILAFFFFFSCQKVIWAYKEEKKKKTIIDRPITGTGIFTLQPLNLLFLCWWPSVFDFRGKITVPLIFMAMWACKHLVRICPCPLFKHYRFYYQNILCVIFKNKSHWITTEKSLYYMSACILYIKTMCIF